MIIRYPINGAGAAAGLDPLLGRYPGDVYDGDNHPWALTTANFAELYYRPCMITKTFGVAKTF